MGETYERAGVSIGAGEQAVQRIKDKVRATFRREVIGDIGGFGGLFALDKSRYRDPVLVASTDGVGTKALVAQSTGRFDTIGIDLVAMCVDDLVCQGAEPLFFLDYVAVGRLDPDHIEAIVGGVAEGCREAGSPATWRACCRTTSTPSCIARRGRSRASSRRSSAPVRWHRTKWHVSSISVSG